MISFYTFTRSTVGVWGFQRVGAIVFIFMSLWETAAQNSASKGVEF